MEMLKSSKAIAAVVTLLFVISLFWLLSTRRANDSLVAGLHKEKLKSESLLSEKLVLEKDIQKIKDQLVALKGESSEYNNIVKSTTEKLHAQESEYNRMKKDNLTLASIKKQRQELISLQAQLEIELQSLRNSYTDLELKNKELSTVVMSLEEQNRILTDDLNRAMFATVDHSQIQALKGKAGKLTVRARKTKKLIANFEVPSNLKNLSFRLIDSKGNLLTADEGTIASTILPSDNNFTASTDASMLGNRLQKVEMIYLPKEKLKTGVYTVEILNDNLYVGSLKVKLK
jgi:hypothetical protein